MKALKLLEPHISEIRKNLENGREIQIGASGPSVVRSFSAPDLVAAGFEATSTGQANDQQ
jgi:hypothetical protein